jgi:glycosyl-4,4'-diaponeurosporenoate acyltransferase
MFLKLPAYFVWVMNIGGLSLLPLLISFVFIQLPDRWFHQDQGLLRLLPMERNGKIYSRILRINRWKGWLPDGGAWMKGGFSKKKLQTNTLSYLQQFTKETRRGEWAHWCMLLMTPLFILWNEGWGITAVFAYAFFANLPCILVQRHNRARFSRLMSRRDEICYSKEMKLVSLEE